MMNIMSAEEDKEYEQPTSCAWSGGVQGGQDHPYG